MHNVSGFHSFFIMFLVNKFIALNIYIFYNMHTYIVFFCSILQRTFNTNHCVFDHEYENFTDRYYRKLNSTMPKWYLGMNKDGSMRCGNVTRKRQKGANFIKIFVEGNDVNKSPPFQPLKKECCTKKSCRKKGCTRKRRCYKNWCNKHRRRFFTLKLKELRRYYKRCVKKADKVRHCSNKRNKGIDNR
jgi:hypothetical protein